MRPTIAIRAIGGALAALLTIAHPVHAAFKTQPYTWKSVVIKGGGFVTGIIPSLAKKDLIYARTDIGGAYRWNAADNRWTPITDWIGKDQNNLIGIESIAADPTDANRVYLAGGTYTASWAGNGAILRSTDQGNSFAVTNVPFQMGSNNDGRSNSERLAVDPNKNNILYFGSRLNGLWKSADYGVTWNTVTSFPAITGRIGIVFVQFVKSSGKSGSPTPTIYAGVSQPGDTLFRSTDAGTAWTAVAGAPGGVPHRAALDSGGMLYLTYNDAPGPNGVTKGSVWKFDTGAGIWTKITPPAGQGGFGGVSIDPAHPGMVVVSTIDRWWPHDEAYRSTDGGMSWKPLLAKTVWDNSSAPWASTYHPHWMGDIEIDPFDSGRAFFVTGYGVFRSSDLASADDGPVHWAFTNNGLEETVPVGLISPPSGAPLLSVLSDIGGFRHFNVDVSPPLADYFQPGTGSNTSIDFAQNAPNLIVRAHSGKARGAYSQDGGATWTNFPTHPDAAEKNGPGSLAISADGKAIVWLPKGSPAFYSTDLGATWLPSAGGPSSPNSYQSMPPVADRVNAGKFTIYDFSTGKLYASTDCGVNFTPTGANLPTGGGHLEAVPGLAGNLWLPAYSGGLLRSTDSGMSFAKLTSVQEAYSVGFGKAAPGKTHPAIYLWGKIDDVVGLFRSIDTGATWVRINDDKHQFGWINVIVGDSRKYGRVYIGTGGRGILYGD